MNLDVAAALSTWRDGLVSLSGTNRLIKFKASKTGALVIDAPEPDAIVAGLRDSVKWSFKGTEPEHPDSQVPAISMGQQMKARGRTQDRILYTARTDAEIGPILRNLMRRAQAEYLDRGLSVLYLAFGMLHWTDVDGTPMASPLLLVPVTLSSRGPKECPDLRIGEDDTALNPPLVLRMREDGIELPDSDDIAEVSVSEMLNRVSESVANQPGWRVEPTVVLSTFSFHKEAMYRDLQDNQDRILAHPVVRALGTKDPTSQSDEFMFDPIAPHDVDRLAPPEETPLVLDADSSQRAVIAAAVSGRSFVMDGPPGTGKSQTIANMIGALLHAGRTVLFVSEKAAALEVVRNRLADAGLENYLLELHSHKASRKEVASALAHALENVPVAPAGMEPLTRRQLTERRARLNDYASAMNEVREPLQLSLHHVLGKLAAMHHCAAAPMPETAPTDLDQDGYQAVLEILNRLQRSWRPAAQGESFLWRDILDRNSLEVRLYQAQSAREELAGVISGYAELAASFGLNAQAHPLRIAEVADLQHANRPSDVPEWWLTTADWADVREARRELASDLDALRSAERAALDAAGVGWHLLPNLTATSRPDSPDGLELGSQTAASCIQTADHFTSTATVLRTRLDELRAMSRNLGLPEVNSFTDGDTILALEELQHSPNRPLSEWMTPRGLADARAAVDALQAALAELAESQSAAAPMFTPEVMGAPVGELQERFSNRHHGLNKLSADYRADKKSLSELLTPGTDFKDALAHLPAAVRWADAATAYTAAAAEHSPVLGRYWRGTETDFVAIAEAMAVAGRVFTLLGDRDVPMGLAEHICNVEPTSDHRAQLDQIRRDLDRWIDSLAAAPALTGRPELAAAPIDESINWLLEHAEPIRREGQRISLVDEATDRTLTSAQADAIIALRQRAEAAAASLRSAEEAHRAVFGALFTGAETDLDNVDRGLQWAQQVCDAAGGPLSDAQVQALTGCRPGNTLSAAVQKWNDAAERVIDAFSSDRHSELRRELEDLVLAEGFLQDLQDDPAGQDEWFAYTQARKELEKHGLLAALEFCIDQRINVEDVPMVIERALLRSWADDIIRSDVRLTPILESDRAALVEEYRKLDKALIETSTSDIIKAANTRRPSATVIGEPGVIRREGMKKTRHMPVRKLIESTRNTALAIKPCFMMSPLAVSQYLPADMNFDVVIFDEASQVTPADAINCVYRGTSLVLAGDDKQLPPTSFFERSDNEDEDDEDTDAADFESVLELAKGSGAFPNLRLRWHYRSRHEALIAFSNYKFYEGKLITYPSSHSGGPDVGVEFFPVAGTYRRGGGADNPVEAARVAERVVHHFETRPDRTLGVVTFSVTQADAIRDAIDKVIEDRPDMQRIFDAEDRLRAFFVKSLESVQGDERDVIIFSIGYGPDENGKITNNFGVLNRPKGWRRLNVAATRARQRVEVVSSLRAGDIAPSTNENVEYLRAYLDYAERGQPALAIDLGASTMPPESPFEESVLSTIRAWGYTVEAQVGSAGFRIDIGIRHPAQPGTFALGVECDGYQYHSAPAARDRDRLRHEILRGLGWRLHRIWGTAWYRNRPGEEERLKNAIEAAIAAPAEGRIDADAPTRSRVVDTAQIEHSETPSWATEYRIAQLNELPRWVNPSEPDSHRDMIDTIRTVAEVEGPVHISLIHQRLRDAWGIGRIGAKISENIDKAIRAAKDVTRRDDFIDLANRPSDRVRTPGDSQARKADQIANSELAMAVRLLLRDAGVTPRNELINATARLFGWSRTGPDIKSRMDTVIGNLLAENAIAEAEGQLSLVE